VRRRLRVTLRGDRAVAALLIGPACLVLAVVFLAPALHTARLSLAPEGGRGGGWTLAHYREVVDEPVVRQVAANTLVFVAASVAGHLAFGLAVALLLNRRLPARLAWRLLALVPWMIPDVIVGIIWRWLLHPLYGPVNALLTGAGLRPLQWLADPTLAMPSLIAVNLWRGTPFVMLILLAGLQAIPADRYEAAAIDGAGRLQQLRHVTLPGLRGALLVALTLDLVWEFRRFGLVAAMTGGGPGLATEVLSTFIYRQYFDQLRFEAGSATAVVLALFVLAVSIPYVRAMVREPAA
jgi:multiple sugar transport system permease protein